MTATCVELGKRQGKTVIVVNDGAGFYTSRILGPYMNEVGHLLAEGAASRTIDQALVDCGFPVGPVTLLDEVGIDVGAKVGTIMERGVRLAHGARRRASPALVADGRKGRKNGRGFYRYEDGSTTRESTRRSTTSSGSPRPPAVAPTRSRTRLSCTFVNEAARCLEDGILRSARDGDIGAVLRAGLPAVPGRSVRHHRPSRSRRGRGPARARWPTGTATVTPRRVCSGRRRERMDPLRG